MRLVIQRVSSANVSVDNKIVGSCDKGVMVLVGFTHGDNEDIVNKMIDKMINLRIFEDANGKMNLSLLDINGDILSISQFTLYASCINGRRPSFTEAMDPTDANELYKYFNNSILEKGIKLETGIFQADMSVKLVNEGPVTIVLDSKELKY